MTASLYATTSLYAVAREAGAVHRSGLSHAVSRPVVDGLAQSECGLLVDVAADRDWRDLVSRVRCAECERVAG